MASQHKDGDAVSAEVINEVLNVFENASKLYTVTPVVNDIDPNESPTVSISADGGFVFNNIKGKTGDTGPKGNDGDVNHIKLHYTYVSGGRADKTISFPVTQDLYLLRAKFSGTIFEEILLPMMTGYEFIAGSYLETYIENLNETHYRRVFYRISNDGINNAYIRFNFVREGSSTEASDINIGDYELYRVEGGKTA